MCGHPARTQDNIFYISIGIVRAGFEPENLIIAYFQDIIQYSKSDASCKSDAEQKIKFPPSLSQVKLHQTLNLCVYVEIHVFYLIILF